MSIDLSGPVNLADTIGNDLSMLAKAAGEGISTALGRSFPVYNAANKQIGSVASLEDLAAGNINFNPGQAVAPSQVQVVDFWGMLKPASSYLADKNITPVWQAAPFVSQAPVNQGITELLFQPASADQYGTAAATDAAAVGSAVTSAASSILPSPNTLIYLGLGLVSLIVLAKKI
jgi:hypothetical protein